MGRNLQIKNSLRGGFNYQKTLFSTLYNKMIFEYMKEGLFIVQNNSILFANRAFYSMHGFNSRNISKKRFLDFVDLEFHNAFKKKIQRMMARKSSQIQIEYYRLHRDGRRIPTELRANRIFLDHGHAFIGICLDLTERKQYEEELKQLKEFNENILNSSSDAITVIDKEGSIIYFSPASERISHRKEREVIGKPLSILYKDEDKELLKEKLEIMEKTNEPVSYETVAPSKGGSDRILFVTRSPLKDKHGNIIGSVGVAKDITEKKFMEEKAREQERLAYIGQLTTLLAHEIRNPLSSIKMNAQILLKKINLTGNDLRRMEIINSEIKRLEKILEEVLNYPKPMILSRKPEDINETIERLLDNLNEKIAEKHIVIEKRFAKNLPKILLDRGKMEQAILNIVLNSIDAVKVNGKLKITTELEKVSAEKIYKIGISDNGVGIEDRNLNRIFEPFYTTKLQGTGLGLTNVKKIIEAHGGFIQVDSQLGGGTTFHIFLQER